MGPESMIVDTLGVYCTYKEVTVTITCMINYQRQIRLKCKLLIRKQHNHCANTLQIHLISCMGFIAGHFNFVLVQKNDLIYNFG